MKQSVFALCLFALPSVGFAATSGPYLGLNVGQSSTDTLHLSDKTDTGIAAMAGYQFNQYLAVEVHYTDFGSITFQSGGSSDVTGYGISVVGSYPFNNDWSAFVKLGATHTTIKSVGNFGDVNRCNGSWGVGGQYRLSPSWDVRLSYDSYGVGAEYNLDGAKTSLTSVGAVYHF
ncbi:MAG: outer membrane beta-barrel protein [Gammaproteobacteria bacterium]